MGGTPFYGPTGGGGVGWSARWGCYGWKKKTKPKSSAGRGVTRRRTDGEKERSRAGRGRGERKREREGERRTGAALGTDEEGRGWERNGRGTGRNRNAAKSEVYQVRSVCPRHFKTSSATGPVFSVFSRSRRQQALEQLEYITSACVLLSTFFSFHTVRVKNCPALSR